VKSCYATSPSLDSRAVVGDKKHCNTEKKDKINKTVFYDKRIITIKGVFIKQQVN